jgi:hypothetical protein
VVEKDATIDDRPLDRDSLELKRAGKLALMAHSFRYGEHGAWDEARAIRAHRRRPVNTAARASPGRRRGSRSRQALCRCSHRRMRLLRRKAQLRDEQNA